MKLGDDFASKRVMARDVDASVVLQESSLLRDSLFVSEGGLNAFVP